MKIIKTTIFLISGSQYSKTFFSEFEMDQYYDDNKHLIKDIDVLSNKEIA